MADDGLLDPAIDLGWLIDTASILGAAETYLLITRVNGWDLEVSGLAYRHADPPVHSGTMRGGWRAAREGAPRVGAALSGPPSGGPRAGRGAGRGQRSGGAGRRGRPGLRGRGARGDA